MKFAQKLACVIVLVLAAAFSLGGSILLYGNFADARQNTEQQNEAQHALACYSLESAVLARHSRGDAVDDAFLKQQVSGTHMAVGKHAAYAAVYRAPTLSVIAQTAQTDKTVQATPSGQSVALFSALPSALDAAAEALSVGSMRYVKENGSIYALYKTQLIEQTILLSAFDVSEIYAVRARSVQRFLWMEGAVLLCAAVAASLLARWLTKPLSTLAAASADIAGGAYEKRTHIGTSDEIGALSKSFDAMAQSVEHTVHVLEAAVQQRDDFMGAFTHELKTPMTAIIGYADTLRTMQCDPDTQKMAASYIFGEAKRVEALSQTLLQLLELTDAPVQLQPVALQTVWRRVQVASAPWCDAVAVSFVPMKQQMRTQLQAVAHTQVQAQCEVFVMADADLLVDLLYNLLHNAVKACDGAGAVQIAWEIQEKYVRLAVADNGRGIPEKLISRVTEPFFMVDKSRTRRSGGSGVGLSLCSKIAQLHNTQLAIESAAGKGTVVSFALALAAPAARTAKPTQTAAQAGQAEQAVQTAPADPTQTAAQAVQAVQRQGDDSNGTIV